MFLYTGRFADAKLAVFLDERAFSTRFSTMADLIPPHGGLKEPLNLTVPPEEIGRFQAEMATLTKVPVSDADLSTVYRFGDGALSPLRGPMNSAAYNRVLDESVVEHEGNLYA